MRHADKGRVVIRDLWRKADGGGGMRFTWRTEGCFEGPGAGG